MTQPPRAVPTSPGSISLSTMLRRKPVEPPGGPEAHGEPHLERSITTFQLTLFGVGATVGTGIFFVLPEAIGRVRITDQIDPADLEAVLAAS